MDDIPPELAALSDVELIKLYAGKTAGDPDIDRIAKEMRERGIEFPPVSL